MHVSSLVDVKALLIWFIGDSISDSFTEHALSTFHIIVHNIFQIGLKSLLVDEVEINVLLRGYLDPDVSFDEVDQTSGSYLIILDPTACFSHFVVNLFKEEDFAWRSDDQGFAVDKNHLAKFFIYHLFESVTGHIIRVNGENLSLSVETVDLVLLFAVETLVRKVLNRRNQFMRSCRAVSDYWSWLNIP